MVGVGHTVRDSASGLRIAVKSQHQLRSIHEPPTSNEETYSSVEPKMTIRGVGAVSGILNGILTAIVVCRLLLHWHIHIVVIVEGAWLAPIAVIAAVHLVLCLLC